MSERLLRNFIKYTSISSQSDSTATTVPSTPGQWDMVNQLQQDLQLLGAEDIQLSEFGILTAYIPSNCNYSVDPVGFVAHVDTVDVNLSPHINAHVVHYTGGDLCQNEEEQIYIRLAEHPELTQYIGQDILVSDGHSVLGADNKAAVSAVMVALEELRLHPEIKHGPIYIAFVPDEEIGLKGSKHLSFDRFQPKYAYTIDSGELGEVVWETFNAASGTLHIKGVSAHPMSAKGVLVNPTLIAVDFANYFNRLETPENTDGTDGYIWLQQINSTQSTATVHLNIRDHNKVIFEERKQFIRDAVELLQKRYPRAKLELTMEDVYGNIKDAITDENKGCIDYIFKAMEALDITPKPIAMRGGTDGSFISTKGIPTPNFFTGGHNFHSSAEFLPMNSFEKSYQMILTLLGLIATPSK